MTNRMEFARAEGPARPEEAQRLRHEAQRWLAGLDLSPDDRERVIAAVSEAVENAVEHAYAARARAGEDGAEDDDPATVELVAWAEADAINVRVVDHGHWLEPDEGEETGEAPAKRGRGFVLMHRSVDSVAIRHTASGTTVALRHHLGRAPEVADAGPEES